MAKATETKGATETAQPVEARPVGTWVLVVKPGLQFRGARGAWYARLLQHNGKTRAEFVASVLASPPSTPTKGAFVGRCEPPAGWLAHFAHPTKGVLTYL